MAQTPEYLTYSRFFFELSEGATGNSQQLKIQKLSGLNINLEVAGEGESIGLQKGLKSDTQFTISSTSFENLSLEFVTTIENDILELWYKSCHPTSYAGGGTAWSDNRSTASVVFLNSDGSEGARFNIIDAIPTTYTTTQMSPDSTDIFKETVEIHHAGIHRVL
ncbi:MAG: phage tail protein [Cyanobacteria bacterium P01_H01_bin.119]